VSSIRVRHVSDTMLYIWSVCAS